MFTGGIRQGKTPNLNKLVAKLSAASSGVRVGIVKPEKNEEGVSVAQYAFYNEYGTKNIPARPFMRQTADEHKDKWRRVFKSNIERIGVTQGEFLGVFDVVGEVAVADMKKVIKDGDFEANAPSTIRQKGKYKGREAPPPMTDTNTLSSFIAYEVEK